MLRYTYATHLVISRLDLKKYPFIAHRLRENSDINRSSKDIRSLRATALDKTDFKY
jgi:hypothetical protein